MLIFSFVKDRCSASTAFKFKKLIATGKLDEWMLYFKCEGSQDEEKKRLMSELMDKNKDIQETHERYDSFTSDEEKRMLYEARWKYKLDQNYRNYLAKNEGIKQGELLGKQQVLIRLLDRKFGLPEDERDFILSVDNSGKLDSALDEIISADTLEGVLSLLK